MGTVAGFSVGAAVVFSVGTVAGFSAGAVVDSSVVVVTGTSGGAVVGTTVGTGVESVVPSVPSVGFSALTVELLGEVAWLSRLPQAAKANSIDKESNNTKIFSYISPTSKKCVAEDTHRKTQLGPVATQFTPT